VFILGSMDCTVANKNNQQLLVWSSLAQQTFLYITEQLNINIYRFIGTLLNFLFICRAELLVSWRCNILVLVLFIWRTNRYSPTVPNNLLF
jgi:hypothetical protein